MPVRFHFIPKAQERPTAQMLSLHTPFGTTKLVYEAIVRRTVLATIFLALRVDDQELFIGFHKYFLGPMSLAPKHSTSIPQANVYYSTSCEHKPGCRRNVDG